MFCSIALLSRFSSLHSSANAHNNYLILRGPSRWNLARARQTPANCPTVPSRPEHGDASPFELDARRSHAHRTRSLGAEGSPGPRLTSHSKQRYLDAPSTVIMRRRLALTTARLPAPIGSLVGGFFFLIVLIADRRCGHVTGRECDERVACEGWKLDWQLQYHRVFAALGGGWLMWWRVGW